MKTKASKKIIAPRSVKRTFIRETMIDIEISEELERMIRVVDSNFRATTSPTNIQKLNGRLEKGLEIVLSGYVHPDPIPGRPNHCRVLSSDGTRYYEVDIDSRSCNCPDSQKGNYCKHRVAVYYYFNALQLLKGEEIEKPRCTKTNSVPAPSREAELLKALGFDPTPTSSVKAIEKPKKKVDEIFAEIRQLHEKLNSQLEKDPSERPQIQNPEDAFKILDSFIGFLDHEEMWIVDLDCRNHVVSINQLYKGSVNSSQVRVSEVFRQAIVENAVGVIVAHNHPSGDTSPSPEDIAVTRSISQAGKLLDIELMDHLIITHGRFVSLKKEGLGFN